MKKRADYIFAAVVVVAAVLLTVSGIKDIVNETMFNRRVSFIAESMKETGIVSERFWLRVVNSPRSYVVFIVKGRRFEAEEPFNGYWEVGKRYPLPIEVRRKIAVEKIRGK